MTPFYWVTLNVPNRGRASVEFPRVPCVGETVVDNGIEYTVEHVFYELSEQDNEVAKTIVLLKDINEPHYE